jgi:hypothetical protein
MQTKKIHYSKERDFSSVFSDSVKYLKQNFKSLFGTVILLGGPGVLITSICISLMMGSVITGLQYQYNGSPDFVGIFGFIAIYLIISMISFSIVICIINEHMILYHLKPEGEKITLNEITPRVKSSFLRVLGSNLVMMVVAFLVYLVIAFTFGTIMSLFGNLGSIGFAFIIFSVIGFMALLFIYGNIFIYQITATNFVVVRDSLFGFKALSKVRAYMKGNFWWTILIMFVASISLYILFLIIYVPIYLLTIFSFISNQQELLSGDVPYALFSIMFFIIVLFSFMIYTVFQVICNFNFLSHEEKHEGKGLQSRIEEITI